MSGQVFIKLTSGFTLTVTAPQLVFTKVTVQVIVSVLKSNVQVF
jgi:hypothetical protein